MTVKCTVVSCTTVLRLVQTVAALLTTGAKDDALLEGVELTGDADTKMRNLSEKFRNLQNRHKVMRAIHTV